MATTKIKWSHFPQALEGYTLKDREEETVLNTVNMMPEKLAEQIYQEHEHFHDESKVMALHVMQNWHKDESAHFEKERYNEMGVELAKRLAQGHSAWVVTHMDRGHIHNHIVISMVHSETGKRLVQSQAMIWKVRQINDQICKENGLSTLSPTRSAQEARMPQKVRDMLSHGRRSYFYDIQQKAEIARSATTGFDEYVQLMKALGVDVNVQNKNVSYFYDSRKKAIRGKSLGARYTNDGLIKAFKENDEKYAKHPDLRARIWGQVNNSHDGKGNLVGAASDLLSESPVYRGGGNKDYGKFTPIARSHARNPLPDGFGGNSLLVEEIKKANSKSIRSYCETNNIALTKNKHGQTVIRGKEFVVFTSDQKLRNTKNNSSVTLVDLVAIHHDISDIQAVAKISGNSRLTLLEDVIGVSKRRFKSFYVPKPERAEPAAAVKVMSHFLKSKGSDPAHAENLLKTKNLHVSKSGSIWIFGEKDDSALELREDTHGKWTEKRHGNPVGVFLESIGKGKRINVYQDPLDYLLKSTKGHSFSGGSDSVLVFLGIESKERLHELLARHGKISEVHLAPSDKMEERKQGQKLLFEMQAKLDPFHIQVKELEMGGPSKDRSRGPDISI